MSLLTDLLVEHGKCTEVIDSMKVVRDRISKHLEEAAYPWLAHYQGYLEHWCDNTMISFRQEADDSKGLIFHVQCVQHGVEEYATVNRVDMEQAFAIASGEGT